MFGLVRPGSVRLLVRLLELADALHLGMDVAVGQERQQVAGS